MHINRLLSEQVGKPTLVKMLWLLTMLTGALVCPNVNTLISMALDIGYCFRENATAFARVMPNATCTPWSTAGNYNKWHWMRRAIDGLKPCSKIMPSLTLVCHPI